MIPGSANPLLLASAAEATGYQIERSLRFNSADSAYLGDTFGTPTDQDVFTLSMWVKRSALGSTQQLFGVSTNHSFGFTPGDALNLTFGGSSALTTTALFRDPSAWYHIMWVQNGTSHALYVNGISVGTASAASNTFNTAVAHQIGAGNTTNFLNGYLAYIHFIDGQAKPPSAFGTDDANGIWQPIEYTGTYGTNGFHLDFADNSTAAALGTDTSGNSNTWTVNNISVTAGAGNDSLVDVPTNGTETDTGVGGEVRGNYCTLNPLKLNGYTQVADQLSDGNLKFVTGSARGAFATFVIPPNSGKWYWEATFDALGNSFPDLYPVIGVNSALNTGGGSGGFWTGYSLNSIGHDYGGQIRYNGVRYTGYLTFNTGDIIRIAYDSGNGSIWFGKAGSWDGGGDPALGTSPPFTLNFYSDGVVPSIFGFSSAAATFNFGQRPFAYTAPSGFKALCTANLPSTTITTSGSYTGNGVADGPFVYLNGVPTAMTIDGNSVTFGTDADKLSNGFKIRTASTAYNQNASTYNYTITSTGDPFKTARAQSN